VRGRGLIEGKRVHCLIEYESARNVLRNKSGNVARCPFIFCRKKRGTKKVQSSMENLRSFWGRSERKKKKKGSKPGVGRGNEGILAHKTARRKIVIRGIPREKTLLPRKDVLRFQLNRVMSEVRSGESGVCVGNAMTEIHYSGKNLRLHRKKEKIDETLLWLPKSRGENCFRGVLRGGRGSSRWDEKEKKEWLVRRTRSHNRGQKEERILLKIHQDT